MKRFAFLPLHSNLYACIRIKHVTSLIFVDISFESNVSSFSFLCMNKFQHM